jgi:hypothetical protein
VVDALVTFPEKDVSADLYAVPSATLLLFCTAPNPTLSSFVFESSLP